MIRRSGTQAAQDELEKAEAALALERQGWAETEEKLAQAIGARDELADVPDAYAGNEERIREFRSELGRRDRVITRREAELEEARSALAHAESEETGTKLAARQKRRQAASAKVAGRLSELHAAVGELVKERDAVAALEAEFQARIPSDVDEWTFPSEARDESDWPELGDLFDVVKVGPVQPLTREAESLARAEHQAEARSQNAIARAVEDVVVHGDFTRFENLASPQLTTAQTLAEERIDAEIERRLAAREDAFQLTGRGDEVLAALDRRRDRVRELADSTLTAA